MCGIYGAFYLDRSQKTDGSFLSKMGKALIHRGPDDSGERVDQYMALGHRRLSIIDLSPSGREPLSNEDESLWLTFNGEIYNYRDFTDRLKNKGHVFKSQTDCETILHLYEEMGIDCLRRLNGMFAFALWDKKKHEVFLVRDRMGIKPLHYAHVQNQVVFGSEIKALLEHPAVSRKLDYRALSDYLYYEYVPAPKTIFSDIKKLLPGHYLHIRNGALREICYWHTRDIETEKGRSEASFAEELRTLLEKSVRRRLVADVPVGAFLSGGIDSSSICAWMQKLIPGRVQTFNIAFEEKPFDESRYAQLVARHLGTDHHVEQLSVKKLLELIPQVTNYLDEPFGDASFFPSLLLSQFTRRGVKVSLSGDGGDELFAGYPTYLAHRWAGPYQRIPPPLRHALEWGIRRLPVSHKNFSLDFKLKKFVSAAGVENPVLRNYNWLGSFAPREQGRLLSKGVLSQLENYKPHDLAESYYASCRNESVLQKILACDQRFYLQDNMLVKIDRASMAASLEARVPFLDHEIVEFSFRLPPALKIRNLTTKYILKKAMAPKLPRCVIERGKKGFGIPLAQWFYSEFKPLLQDVFAESKLKREGIFEAPAVSRLLREHFERRKDNRKEIYTLLNFELWRERYAPF